jgi:hypothetical protein
MKSILIILGNHGKSTPQVPSFQDFQLAALTRFVKLIWTLSKDKTQTRMWMLTSLKNKNQCTLLSKSSRPLD